MTGKFAELGGGRNVGFIYVKVFTDDDRGATYEAWKNLKGRILIDSADSARYHSSLSMESVLFDFHVRQVPENRLMSLELTEPTLDTLVLPLRAPKSIVSMWFEPEADDWLYALGEANFTAPLPLRVGWGPAYLANSYRIGNILGELGSVDTNGFLLSQDTYPVKYAEWLRSMAWSGKADFTIYPDFVMDTAWGSVRVRVRMTGPQVGRGMLVPARVAGRYVLTTELETLKNSQVVKFIPDSSVVEITQQGDQVTALPPADGQGKMVHNGMTMEGIFLGRDTSRQTLIGALPLWQANPTRDTTPAWVRYDLPLEGRIEGRFKAKYLGEPDSEVVQIHRGTFRMRKLAP